MIPSPSTPEQVRDGRKTAFAVIAIVLLTGGVFVAVVNGGHPTGGQVTLSVRVVPFAPGENYTLWIPALLKLGSAAWIVDGAGQSFEGPELSVATTDSGTWINLSESRSVSFFAWTTFASPDETTDMHWSALDIAPGGAQHLRFSAWTEHGDPVGVSVTAEYDGQGGRCSERVAASDMVPGDGTDFRILLEVHDPC